MRTGKKSTESKSTGTYWQRVKSEAATDAAVAAYLARASISAAPGPPP